MNSAEYDMNMDEPRNGSKKGKYKQCRGGRDGVWTPLNIGIMVVAFVFGGPLGLVVLVPMLLGVSPLSLPGKAMKWMREQGVNTGDWSMSRTNGTKATGNRVFDEYQQTQLDRIDEIRTEVRERGDRFQSFKSDRERQKEQREFDRFMGRSRSDDDA